MDNVKLLMVINEKSKNNFTNTNLTFTDPECRVLP